MVIKPRRRARRRARRAAALTATVGVLALGSVAAALSLNPVPSPVAGAFEIEMAAGKPLTITWLGDTFMGDEADRVIDQHGLAWLSGNLPPLDPDHAVIANLEGPITEHTEAFDPMQRWTYSARLSVAPHLKELGIDALQLANNHAMDRGPIGLADTVANLTAAGLGSFGAGASSNEARLPVLVKGNGMTIAVAGFEDDGGLKTASLLRPGVRRLSLENIAADIDAARRAGADRVVAAVHWGGNYTGLDERQRLWAKSLADAGYDLVIGTGPHIVQAIEVLDGMPVVYSLGNYVFGTPGRFNPSAQGFGLVLTTTFSERDEIAVVARCIQNDNEIVQFQARPCDRAQAAMIFGETNPGLVQVGDDTATMTLPLRSKRP
jgi:poly-gamma-glutamate capsule biosynthesis protein CapA/YwtB (metallophosphatase superfamily)